MADPLQQRADEERPEIDELAVGEAPRPNYRVAADLPARAAELEREVDEMRAEKKQLEHELYVTRQKLRRRAATRATSIGGLGALVGSVVGGAVYAGTGDSRAIVVSTILGAVFGGLAFGRWVPPDDDFPDAPPPRFR
jgi:hypothetical protein